jgi:proline iminopeptidase
MTADRVAAQPPLPSLPSRRTGLSVLRCTAGWLLAVAASPLGALCAMVALLATAAITGSRALAVVASMVAALIGTGGLAMLAARLVSGRRQMRHWLAGAVTAVTASTVAILVGWLVFSPPPPSTPAVVTADVRFWELPTGSRIAYTYTPAQRAAKPTPVVLVHGGPGAPAGRHDALAQELAAAGFSVYDYHQIGAGLSARLADVSQYTVARHVADLDAIRHTLGADRLVLVGASWGAKLIASYLAVHPHRVAAAVIDSPPEIWSPAFTDPERLTDTGRRDQRAAVARHPRFATAHVLMRTVGPRAAHTLLPDAQMDGVFELFVSQINKRPGCHPAPTSETDTVETPHGFGFWVNAVTTMDAERVADPRPALRSATAPVLVLRGECDYISWEATREYRDLLPNATLLAIANAGHTVTTDQPHLHRRLVRAFLLGEPLPQPAYHGTRSPWP